MFDALAAPAPESGGGVAPSRMGIARVARLRSKRAPALLATGCALLVSLTACGDTGSKPSAPAPQTSLTAPASPPTTSAAPAPSPQPQTTEPAPSPPPETTEPAAPESTAAPSQHSGDIRGGEFCKQDEQGWTGFDGNGDAYVCRDIDHNGHPQWVKPSAGASPSQADAADVVQRYYAAINAQDYATAWALGGQNLVGSYEEFVNDFAGTQQDTLSIVSVAGQSVQIQLDAEQTDGSHRYYAGTYTVSDGVIVAADVTQQ